MTVPKTIIVEKSRPCPAKAGNCACVMAPGHTGPHQCSHGFRWHKTREKAVCWRVWPSC